MADDTRTEAERRVRRVRDAGISAIASIVRLSHDAEGLTPTERDALREDASTAKRIIDAMFAERDELRKLLSPEVQRAAEWLARNADAHSSACCPVCSEGLAERDALRARVAELERMIVAALRRAALRKVEDK